MFVVQYFFARVGLKGSARDSLQWSQNGMRWPWPSHSAQPGVHPCENQNTDWPGWQAFGSVPLTQWTFRGSNVPVWLVPLPQFAPGMVESIAFRGAGVIMAP